MSVFMELGSFSSGAALGEKVSGEMNRQTPWERQGADYSSSYIPSPSEKQKPSSNGHSTPSQRASPKEPNAPPQAAATDHHIPS